MNEVLETIHARRSLRAYASDALSELEKTAILDATLRSPTAGNLMLYTIIEVNDQALKDRLAVTCDNQPFIARAPWVLLFLADYQRWVDIFEHHGAEQHARASGIPTRQPGVGDLMLGICDALIAAQTAVLAAQSLGIGSCYIGDILENYEVHREMFALPRYTFPITMLCFGYPTQSQPTSKPTRRYAREFIVHNNRYQQLSYDQLDSMLAEEHRANLENGWYPPGIENVGQYLYMRKQIRPFSIEMQRSVAVMLENWK